MVLTEWYSYFVGFSFLRNGMFIPRAHFDIRTFMSYKGIKLRVLRTIRNNSFIKLQRLPLPKIRTWNEHSYKYQHYDAMN